MKTREETKSAFDAEPVLKGMSGYRDVPADWTLEELRQASRDGFVKLAAGRYQFIASRKTPRDKGMGWRYIKEAN